MKQRKREKKCLMKKNDFCESLTNIRRPNAQLLAEIRYHDSEERAHKLDEMLVEI